MQSRHPVMQHASVLVVVVLALLLLAVTANVNPHSTAWLAGAFLCLVVTILSFRHAESDPRIRKAYRLYTACMGLYFLVVWLLHISIPRSAPPVIEPIVVLWAKVLRAGTIFLPVCYLRFTRIFTKSQSSIISGLEGAAWFAAAAFYVTNWLDLFAVSYRWSGKTWAPTLGGAYKYFFYYTIVVIGFSTIYSAVKVFQAEHSQQRIRLFYFLVGTVPLWITILSNFLLSIGINVYPAAGFFFIIHISILAYAVLRRKVFEVTLSLTRGLAYAVASLCLGGAYGGLLWLLTQYSGFGSQSVNFFIAPIFMAISGFILAPFVDSVQVLLDRIFFRASFNRQRAFDELTRETSKSIQLAQIAEALCRFFKATLSPQRVSIFLVTRRSKLALYASYADSFKLATWPHSPVLTSSLESFVKVRTIAEVEIHDETKSAIAGVSFTVSHRGVVADITHNEELLGCVVLHPKLADDRYSSSDKQFIVTAITHSSLAISNAHSFQKLEELQLQTIRVLNGLSAGVISIQLDGKVLHANRAAKGILGLSEESTDVQVGDALKANSSVHEALLSTFAAGKDIENKEISIAGSRQILMNTQLHRNDGEEDRVTILMHDITEYKAMEATLRRNAGLTQAGEMIAGINHEIRNVFQPIKYQVRMLNRNRDRTSEDLVALEVMGERLAAMDTLLENLKNLARPIQLRKFELNLVELIESVWRDLSSAPMTRAVKFTLSIEGEASIEADGHWLRQVFYNILRNASEAMAERENATVSVKVQGDVNSVEVTFLDNGPGISEEIRERLFTPFVSTKGAAGTGLGLTISKRAIELHSGTLRVESSKDGTAFFVKLPRSHAVSNQRQSS